MTLKVLNLYAGIGGNRKLWVKPHIKDDIEVTAVEIEPKIAKIYQDFFPNDKVIVTDAHQFLLEHFNEFDFIWSSPPCPTHSRFRLTCHGQKLNGVNRPDKYPNMELYEEIIFLNHFCKKLWVVENVISYYKPLVEPFVIDGHYFWSNFPITIQNKKHKENDPYLSSGKQLSIKIGFDWNRISGISQFEKRHVLRNCVMPKIGLHIFNMAFRDKQKTIGEMVK